MINFWQKIPIDEACWWLVVEVSPELQARWNFAGTNAHWLLWLCLLFWWQVRCGLWFCRSSGPRWLPAKTTKNRKWKRGRERTGRLLFLLRLIGALKLLTEAASCSERREKEDGVLGLGLVTWGSVWMIVASRCLVAGKRGKRDKKKGKLVAALFDKKNCFGGGGG